MGSDEEHAADWSDAAAYAPLLEADRSIFAWEWLRRDAGYRAAARHSLAGSGGGDAQRPGLWGLHAFEKPDLGAPNARPVWRAEVHPFVLSALASRSGPPSDAFELSRLATMATIVSGGQEREHLLLSDGLRTIRIDILAGTAARGPVQLRYLLAGFASAERPLLTLRRLLALCRTGRLSPSRHPAEARARRFILMLRAHDAMANGATQREIASALLSTEAEEDRWRVTAPTVRSRVQRLVRSARTMAGGGYASLLES